MKLLFSVLLLSFAVCLSAAVPKITLLWDPNPVTDGVTNYFLSWRSPTNAPLPVQLSKGTNITATLEVTNFSAGVVRFTVSAVNSNGITSVPSDPVYWTNRYFAPVLRLEDTNTSTLALQQSDKITGPWTNVAQTPSAPTRTTGFYRGLTVLDPGR
jgi:hypothetical protein